tara:strand:- start:274 stop:447 length:174 start_codon:yes stop_codon:yes gene_type:complete
MKLKDLTDSPEDYLDAYCEAELGHTNWAFIDPQDLNNQEVWTCVVFFNSPLPKEEHE